MVQVGRTGAGVVLLAVLVLWGCGSIIGGGDDVVTLEVAEARVPCIGVGPRDCLLVRFPGDEYGMFYDAIEGFAWEPGYRYRLRVSRRTVANPPADGSSIAYRLVRVESKVLSPRHELLEAAWAAEARWREARPAAYAAVLERVCFCTPEGRGPVRLRVEIEPGTPHEWVLDRHYLADGSRVSAALAPFFPGVEQLFGVIARAVANDAHAIDVEYDAALGYPRRVYVDWHAGIADDEVEYRVLELLPD